MLSPLSLIPSPNPPGSNASCSSCGCQIEHDVALCPWCGRVVLSDVMLSSEKHLPTRSRRPEALGAGSSTPLLSNLIGDRHDD
jgi:hypothetical protein